MVRILFHNDADGAQTEAERTADTSLLALAQAAGLPLEGTCEGQMACSTCHVILTDAVFAGLPRPSEAEEDMLDLAAGACRTSRLSCQINVGELPDGAIVRIPRERRDMQGI